MIKGFRTKIYPNQEQQDKIIKFCNTSRFAYNWALNIEEDNYKNGGKFISGYDLTKLFTQLKKQEENEWLKEIPACTTKIAILNCAESFKNFFEKRAKHPKFKSKRHSKMKCATRYDRMTIKEKSIKLECLGWIRIVKNKIPVGENLKYLNPKLEYDGIDFWFSVGVEIIDKQDNDKHNNKSKTEAIGIDLGIKTLVTCSDGVINNKPNIKKEKKKLKRLQRRASKHYKEMIDLSKQTKTKFVKLPKSKNLLKLEKDIKKVYRRIESILNNNIHTFTKSLINLNPEAIVIEDLNVKGMMKNKHLSEKIKEAKFYEIRRQLEYKCKWNDVKLIIADRWYPSSKRCSCCGNKKEKLSLSERVYVCEECSFEIDRDLNAAINLKNLAYAT